MWETPPFEALLKSLDDPSNPIGMRLRAAYHLRHEHSERPEEVVDGLSKGLLDHRHGALMRHEFARTAADVVWRRTKLGLRLTPDQIATLDTFMAQAI